VGGIEMKKVTLKYENNPILSDSFKGNQYIEELTILDGFKEIPFRAFCNCSNLKKVEIPGKSVKKIGGYVFNWCGNLADVKLNEGLEEIDEGAFFCCENLPIIEIPKSVKKIGDNAFSWCENLADVTLQEGLEEIGDFTFYWCKKLPRIKIPKSVKRIGNNAFEGCETLQTIDIDNTETFVKKNWSKKWLGKSKANIIYTK
jgi:hypothetical protein